MYEDSTTDLHLRGKSGPKGRDVLNWVGGGTVCWALSLKVSFLFGSNNLIKAMVCLVYFKFSLRICMCYRLSQTGSVDIELELS